MEECDLTRQMVCYTEPSEKSSLETVWKRADTFKKYVAGDWMNHRIYHHHVQSQVHNLKPGKMDSPVIMIL